MIDENRFFREVSIRICSSLDIEKALARCFSFLKDVMPIDELMLVVYERELGSTTIKAIVDSTGARCCSEQTPLPSCLRKEFELVEEHERARSINAFDDPIVSYVARRRHWKDSSLLVNRLVVDGSYIGALVTRAEGRGRYTDEHLRLWSLVNEPSAIALSNNLQYREISRLKDVLVDDKSYLQEEAAQKDDRQYPRRRGVRIEMGHGGGAHGGPPDEPGAYLGGDGHGQGDYRQRHTRPFAQEGRAADQSELRRNP